MTESKSGSSAHEQLSVRKHDRDASAMQYVYPVVSRRAGGVSVGINLNINNACNWACIYCQVPNLARGGPLPVDIAILAGELAQMLDDVLDGDFLARRVPEGMRRLADIAFSGNGEPTSSDQFPAAVEVVISALQSRGLAGNLPIRVITNGSLLHRPVIQRALGRIGALGGEVWFKIDRGSESGLLAVNQTAISLTQVERNLVATGRVAPVWVQTCWFGLDGNAPTEQESDEYVALIAKHRSAIRGVHLYGIARPSLQPGSEKLLRLPIGVLKALATKLNAIGVTATVSE